MKKFIKVLLVTLVLGLNMWYIVNIYNLNRDNACESITVMDTTINRLRIDSIELVITRQDSIIYNIKYAADEEIKQAMSDSVYDAVSRFIELVSDTSSYGGFNTR